jgi:hypothetical protein
MIGTSRPWPPIIVADYTPRFIRWRDFLLTLLMWIIFAIMLETEFALFFGHFLVRVGIYDFYTKPDWPEFLTRMVPFLGAIATLVLMLVVASVSTSRRRRSSLLLPTPAPLAVAEECRRAGMDETALASARTLRIAVVHIDADGKHRVETDHADRSG